MRDATLKDLSQAIGNIARDTVITQGYIKDIRDMLCDPASILYKSLSSPNVSSDSKDSRLLKSRPTKDSGSDISKALNKYSNSVISYLKTIIEKIDKGSGKASLRDARNVNAPGDKNEGRKINDLGNLSRSIDVVEKLRNIKLKDLLFAKIKIKSIKSIITRFQSIFKGFKNNKEATETMNFASTSIELVKKLAKVSLLFIPAKIGAMAMENIFLGAGKKKDGGLLGLFIRLHKNEKAIKNGAILAKHIKAACGSLLLSAMMLSVVAVVGIPAMLGALLTMGIVKLLSKSFDLLSKANKNTILGATVLLIMSTSIIAFALGLGLTLKAVRGASWKDFGMMMASIGSLGGTLALMGLISPLIALGSLALITMGAGLGVFALSMLLWRNINVGKAIENIKEAVGGLREVFGLDSIKRDDSKPRKEQIKGGLMDVAMAFLSFGKTFFVMGSLLLVGATLGMLYVGLKNWANFNDSKKAISNAEIAINGLKKLFGLEDPKGGTSEKLKALGGGLLDLGVALFSSGKALVVVGTIAIATAMSDMIRLCLSPWSNFDPANAVEHMGTAINGLKDLFGLQDTGNTAGAKFGAFGGGILDLATALLSAGRTLVTMGTIMLAVGMLDIIKVGLIPWEDYDASKAIGHLSDAMTGLKAAFGFKDVDSDLKGQSISAVGDLLSFGSTLLKAGGVLVSMGTILIATGMLSKIKENLKPWEDYNAEVPVANIAAATGGLLGAFGLDQFEENAEKAEENRRSFWEILKGTGKSLVKGIGNIFGSISKGIQNASKRGGIKKTMKFLDEIIAGLAVTKQGIDPWVDYDSEKPIGNIGYVVENLIKNMDLVSDNDGVNQSRKFKKFATNVNASLEQIKEGFKGMDTFSKPSTNPLYITTRAINGLNIEKASKMIELFKSFSKIGKRPFDKFTEAVHEFSNSCNKLIDSLDEFNSNSSGETVSEGSTTVNGGVSINNTDALAEAIAKAIKSLPINVRTDISDVRLVVDNATGKRVVLTLDN